MLDLEFCSSSLLEYALLRPLIILATESIRGLIASTLESVIYAGYTD